MSFNLNVRMYYEDTDAGGIVYHANYLRYAERARTEYLHSLGVNHKDVLGLVVTSADIKYKAPATLADEITVKTSILKLGAASIVFSQNIYRDDTLLVEMVIKVAAVNKSIKPVKIPDNLKSLLLADFINNS